MTPGTQVLSVPQRLQDSGFLICSKDMRNPPRNAKESFSGILGISSLFVLIVITERVKNGRAAAGWRIPTCMNAVPGTGPAMVGSGRSITL